MDSERPLAKGETRDRQMNRDPLSGALAAWLGPVGSVLAGGVGTLLVAALWMRLFPTLRRRESLAGHDVGKA